MGQVHFIASEFNAVTNVCVEPSGSNTFSIISPSRTYDPMQTIIGIYNDWPNATLLRIYLSKDSMLCFVSPDAFLIYLRSLACDVYIQNLINGGYHISFTSQECNDRFQRELDSRNTLRIRFSNMDTFRNVEMWLRDEYAANHDYHVGRNWITCRDAELASMIRLKYSPDCT